VRVVEGCGYSQLVHTVHCTSCRYNLVCSPLPSTDTATIVCHRSPAVRARPSNPALTRSAALYPALTRHPLSYIACWRVGDHMLPTGLATTAATVSHVYRAPGVEVGIVRVLSEGLAVP
jgi:hypothetical protein